MNNYNYLFSSFYQGHSEGLLSYNNEVCCDSRGRVSRSFKFIDIPVIIVCKARITVKNM